MPGGAATPAAGPSYCCYGCRFAAKVSAVDGQRPDPRSLFTRLGLAIFCTMNVMAFTMALWSGDVPGDDAVPIRRLPASSVISRCSSRRPVFYALGLPLLENAWDSVKRGIANIDVLLIAGVGASFAVSIYSVFRDQGPVYFEVGCMVLVLVTLGRWLEATGKARPSHSLDMLEKLLPENVFRFMAKAKWRNAYAKVIVGDCLHVHRTGERIPCDGVLLGPAD